MSIDLSIPYNQLPELPPGSDLETKEILKQCIKSRAALAQLHKLAIMLPNQSVLINTLPLLEAQASSEIENIVTTADSLFRAVDQDNPKNIDAATKEALRYRAALYMGWQQVKIRPTNTVLAEEICSTLRGVDMSIRKTPGTTLKNQTTGEIIYTPPEGEDLLRRKLHNWEVFLHSNDDIDPLIKMAVGHYQFEAIHPFTDGNGRTGRILNVLYLIEYELLTIPILYLSRFIIKNKPDYYRLLASVTLKQDWSSWVLFLLKGIEETSIWTSDKVQCIMQLMDETVEFVKAKLPKIYSKDLIEILFVQPYCRIHNLTEQNIVARQTASEYLKKLTKIGVLKEYKDGREKLFINPRLMEVLSQDENSYTEFK